MKLKKIFTAMLLSLGLALSACTTTENNTSKEENPTNETSEITPSEESKESTLVESSVEKLNFEGVTFNGDEFTYDGSVKSLAVKGLPEGASVNYINNDKTLPGLYTVKAKITKEGYNDLELEASLLINPAKFTGITLDGNTVDYDGNVKSLEVKGLPEGASVTYTDNENKNPGVYTVKATVKMEGYSDLELEATLTINALEFKGYKYDEDLFDYDGTEHIINITNLPEGTKVTASDNKNTLPGEYTASFKLECEGYKTITVTKDYMIVGLDFKGVKLEDDIFEYDGKAKSLVVTGAPDDSTITYKYYDKDNKEVEPILPGEYTVKATVEKTGYNKLELSATLYIEALTISYTTLGIEVASYDGKVHNVPVTITTPDVKVTYVTYTKTGVKQDPILPGEYIQTITLEKVGYETVTIPNCEILIEAGKLSCELKDATVSYDGTKKTLTATNIPEGATVVYSYYEEGNKSNKSNDGMIEKGTYHVDCVINLEGYEQLKLEATMTIVGKTQTLSTSKSEYSLTYGDSLKDSDIYSTLTLTRNGNSVTVNTEYIWKTLYKADSEGNITEDTLSTAPAIGTYYIELIYDAQGEYDLSNALIIKVVINKGTREIEIDNEITRTAKSGFNYFGSAEKDSKYTFSADLSNSEPGEYDLTIILPADEYYLEAKKTIKVKLVSSSEATVETDTYSFMDKRYSSNVTTGDCQYKITQAQTSGNAPGIAIGSGSNTGKIVFTFKKSVKSIKITYCPWLASGNTTGGITTAYATVNGGTARQITTNGQVEEYTDINSDTVTVSSTTSGKRLFVLKVEVVYN